MEKRAITKLIDQIVPRVHARRVSLNNRRSSRIVRVIAWVIAGIQHWRWQYQRHPESGLPEELLIFVYGPEKGDRSFGEMPRRLARQAIPHHAGRYPKRYHNLVPRTKLAPCHCPWSLIERKQLDHVPISLVLAQPAQHVGKVFCDQEVILEDEAPVLSPSAIRCQAVT